MHRRSRFLIGLATAVITFSSLWFTLGPAHFNRGHRMCHTMEQRCYLSEEREDDNCCNQMERHQGEKVIVIKEVIKKDSVKK